MTFEQLFMDLRPGLNRLAYQMLGIHADAEDVVQDAYVRWHRVDPREVAAPKAYLRQMVTRLCLDRIKSARSQREVYVGPWLPEPVLEPLQQPSGSAGDSQVDTWSELSYAVLVLLESCTPEQRAVFVLRETLELPYEEIGATLGMNAVNCRQLHRRAREKLGVERERAPSRSALEQKVLGQLFGAIYRGDAGAVAQCLQDEAILISDGGGKARAALRPIYSADKIARFLVALKAKGGQDMQVRMARVNGELGVELSLGGRVDSLLAFEFEGAEIRRLFLLRNPDKLSSGRS